MASVNYKGEDIYSLPESQHPDLQSVFFMSVHKSGSTMMNNVVREICKILEYEFVDIQSFFFNNGIPDSAIPENTGNIFKPKGYVYSGFRYIPHQYPIACLTDCPVIILLRDPRDAIVSQYFSVSQSHPLPGEGLDSRLREKMIAERERALNMDIDKFCLLNIGGFAKQMDVYWNLAQQHPNIRIFHYEEIIYMKKKWILNIRNFLKWPLTPADASKLANRFNIIPDQEREDKHIRQVHPQNYLKKLKPETIKQINKTHKRVLTRFRYL